MTGHVLIVDRNPGRRAALRRTLGLPEDEVIDLADPAGLPDRVAQAPRPPPPRPRG